ncbi:MAG: hypothetical protein ACRELG_07235 [Gemmataceae bacterium]
MDKNAIQTNGIALSCCAVAADFGRGFYTTTVERQSRQRAWDRFYKWQLLHPTGTGNQPVVLRFRVRRYTLPSVKGALDEGLDKLVSLAFVLGDYHDEDYWSLVQHCRQSTKTAINDHRHPAGGWYDLVSGPVAAFWEQRVIMDDADQFSFHTAKAVRLLNALIQEGLKSGPNGNPDYYIWYPVTP